MAQARTAPPSGAGAGGREERRGPPGRRRDGAAAAGPGRGATVHHLGIDDRSSPRVRVVDAALRCIAQAGTAKTTLDDVAREAGMSRATVYRVFPGGKEAVLQAVVETETARLFSELGAVMGDADDLEQLLVEGIVGAARHLTGHDALSYLLAHEPGRILPHLAFAGMDRLLAVASDFAAPFLGRWLAPEDALRSAEWAVRILVSHLVCPDEDADLTDRAAVRRLVATFVIPGIQALRLSDHGSRRAKGAAGTRAHVTDDVPARGASPART